MPGSMSITRFQSQTDPRAPDAGDKPKLHVVTFGCQMNKYDSLLVEGRFKRAGYVTTGSIDDADVVLFNTCSVRDHAEERTWSWVGELKQVKAERPDLVIGVMGCMAQRVEGEVFKRAGHVDLVVGTRQFQHLPGMVAEVRARRARPDAFRARDMRLLATDMTEDVAVEREGEEYTGGRHGYLAVMRGCDLNCTYCIVPTTRGRVRSRPIDDLVREAEWMVAQGAQVITLLGQTVNSYGEDFSVPGPGEARMLGRQGRPSLADLLYRLQELEGLVRIRLVTLHPSYVTRPFARAIRDCDKVDRFLPLPAQSGSDAVLKRMKRGYNLDLYRKRVAILREFVPDIELGSDWIVGFCGETEADFAGSEALLEELEFAVNYIFKYDPRPATHAAERLDDDLDVSVKKARNRRLLAVAERVQRTRLARYAGTSVRAFVESTSERDPRVLLGRTIHGVPVSFRGAQELVGTTIQLAIDETTAYGLAGRAPELAGR
ncbi:MAG: tRNA (N6-isopentenyl adenosine(37)-C2)-methylthiotransferase MiaB [Planctomycetota bacterium]|nr:MAG: tRNA (N6-isopentenyl adenosine(37)-C2)-methylthiotransferase MiaB [Planctomycetota bacterium]